MRVLVTWARPSGNANLGVAVLAEGSAALVRAAWGDETDVGFQDFGRAEGMPGFTRKTLLKDMLCLGYGPVRKRLRQFDWVLDTGAGDSFTDGYGLSRLLQMTYVRVAARRAGVALVLGPQTIGPFSTRVGRRIGKLGLHAAHVVIARDSTSARASSELGRDVDALITDVVFALPLPDQAATERDIILNVSGLLWHDNPHVPAQHYRAIVREIIDYLLSRGRGVTLLAHVADQENLDLLDNDVPALLALQSEYGDAVEIFIPGSLDEVRATLRHANLVIGSRMHACLNALSVGTPAVPLAYSRKFAPLMADLGWPHHLDLREVDGVADPCLRLIDTVLADVAGATALVHDLSSKARVEATNAGAVLRDMLSAHRHPVK